MKKGRFPRHLISVRDLDPGAIADLFEAAAQLKNQKDRQDRSLAGKTLGLLFQKPSVRTRVSFEVGMAQLGGQSIYMGPVELQNGKREAPKDLAKVLSRYLDGFIARTFAHKDVEELAREATVPVINGLSDFEHPCQALSDLFTIQEKLGKVRGIRIAFVGDGNNVCHSLLMGCALLGARLSVATPASHRPDPKVVGWSQEMAKRQAGQILLSQDPQKAVRSARIVYTDVWASMGQEHQRERRKKIFRKFQVNRELLKEAPEALFMHCLPAHRGEEVTDEVIDSKRSIVYDQAENRLHLQKAILLNLL